MKRMGWLLLTAALCLCLAGCGSLLDGEYESVSLSEDELPIQKDGSLLVRNYLSLRNALLGLVSEHQEGGVLTVSGYTGDVTEDLPKLCAELKSDNALCAYAVDYISYDLNRIVSYYEAHVYINYSRSQEQLAELVNIGTVANMPRELQRALREGREQLAFSAVGSPLTQEAVQTAAEDCYYAAPLEYLSAPRTELSVYPNSGISRIYEIRLDYGEGPQLRQSRLEELRGAAQAMTGDLEGDEGARALQAAARLSEQCALAYNHFGSSITAYGALVQGRADAQGRAMGYKALCDNMDIQCLVVSGRREKQPHTWNLVRIGESYYHIDVSRLGEEQPPFLQTDSELRSSYWWDIDLYPATAEPPASTPPPTEQPELEPEMPESPDVPETIPEENATLDLKFPED